MHSNLFLYLTAMSVVSLHNFVDKIDDIASKQEPILHRTFDTSWSLSDQNINQQFPSCNGTKQSPIDIKMKDTKLNLNLRLGLTAYDKPISGFLMNQFPTFQLEPISLRWPRPSALISDSTARSFNLLGQSQYSLNFVQFYWSHKDQTNSSIHRLDGQSYPLEIHFIHYNSNYATLEEASTKPDGLLILSVMVLQSSHESYLFDKLLSELSNVTMHGQQVTIDEESTWRSLLPSDTSKFYRYQGSMILPPCHESVQWIVFEDKLKLGAKQLKRLKRHKFYSKETKSGKEIDWTNQRRPLNPLNGRIIEKSFEQNGPKSRSLIRNNT